MGRRIGMLVGTDARFSDRWRRRSRGELRGESLGMARCPHAEKEVSRLPELRPAPSGIVEKTCELGALDRDEGPKCHHAGFGDDALDATRKIRYPRRGRATAHAAKNAREREQSDRLRIRPSVLTGEPHRLLGEPERLLRAPEPQMGRGQALKKPALPIRIVDVPSQPPLLLEGVERTRPFLCDEAHVT